VLNERGIYVANSDVRLTGNVTRDPDLRFTPAGVAVCNFGVAVNERRLDKATDKWVDVLAGFFDVTVWREPAENVTASISKGDRVVVLGRLVTDSYEKDGATHNRTKVEADEVAVSLRFSEAKVLRVDRRKPAENEPF
jgi:single-strand DNA-binding protein